MNYEDLLNEAFSKMVKKESKDRFNPPQPEIEYVSDKTVIKNFVDISEYIKRDVRHFSRYMMKSLATVGEIKGKSLILFSKIRKEQIVDRINAYIKNYVICKFCKEPDTKLEKEGRIYFIECDACGGKYAVEK
ncbi:MAG: translation initiation factor IF-2 subunit beta [Candidatus Aenigmatarchaeota archaeon]